MQKRRIYDITNVLEGIGLIEKTVKNRIQWKYVYSLIAWMKPHSVLSICVLVCVLLNKNLLVTRGLDSARPGDVDESTGTLQVYSMGNFL